MAHEALGEFEQLVLLAIVRLSGHGDDVYAVPIVEEIERRTGRPVSRAAVYVTLRRMERKRLISSWLGEPREERGGKSRRCVAVEPAGVELLKESRRVMNRMWERVGAGIREVS